MKVLCICLLALFALAHAKPVDNDDGGLAQAAADLDMSEDEVTHMIDELVKKHGDKITEQHVMDMMKKLKDEADMDDSNYSGPDSSSAMPAKKRSYGAVAEQLSVDEDEVEEIVGEMVQEFGSSVSEQDIEDMMAMMGKKMREAEEKMSKDLDSAVNEVAADLSLDKDDVRAMAEDLEKEFGNKMSAEDIAEMMEKMGEMMKNRGSQAASAEQQAASGEKKGQSGQRKGTSGQKKRSYGAVAEQLSVDEDEVEEIVGEMVQEFGSSVSEQDIEDMMAMMGKKMREAEEKMSKDLDSAVIEVAADLSLDKDDVRAMAEDLEKEFGNKMSAEDIAEMMEKMGEMMKNRGSQAASGEQQAASGEKKGQSGQRKGTSGQKKRSYGAVAEQLSVDEDEVKEIVGEMVQEFGSSVSEQDIEDMMAMMGKKMREAEEKMSKDLDSAVIEVAADLSLDKDDVRAMAEDLEKEFGNKMSAEDIAEMMEKMGEMMKNRGSQAASGEEQAASGEKKGKSGQRKGTSGQKKRNLDGGLTMVADELDMSKGEVAHMIDELVKKHGDKVTEDHVIAMLEKVKAEVASVGSMSMGSASMGSASMGSASLGSASLGSASLGSASLGSASLGSASVDFADKRSMSGPSSSGSEDMDMAEVAQQLGMSEEAVMGMIFALVMEHGENVTEQHVFEFLKKNGHPMAQ